jgi:hypothetical protein
VTDDDGGLIATVPSFRPDLDREIDLVEEVARRIGFDRIGRTRPDTHGQVGTLSARQRDRRTVADALVGLGLSEAITFGFIEAKTVETPVRRSRYDVAVLQALDKVTADSVRFEAAVGRPVRYKSLVFTVKACERVFSAAHHERGAAPMRPEHVAAVSVRRRAPTPVESDRPVDVTRVDALRGGRRTARARARAGRGRRPGLPTRSRARACWWARHRRSAKSHPRCSTR